MQLYNVFEFEYYDFIKSIPVGNMLSILYHNSVRILAGYDITSGSCNNKISVGLLPQICDDKHHSKAIAFEYNGCSCLDQKVPCMITIVKISTDEWTLAFEPDTSRL
jgi:hypothetical protein